MLFIPNLFRSIRSRDFFRYFSLCSSLRFPLLLLSPTAEQLLQLHRKPARRLLSLLKEEIGRSFLHNEQRFVPAADMFVLRFRHFKQQNLAVETRFGFTEKSLWHTPQASTVISLSPYSPAGHTTCYCIGSPRSLWQVSPVKFTSSCPVSGLALPRLLPSQTAAVRRSR